MRALGGVATTGRPQPPSQSEGADARLREACVEFEAVLLGQMLRQMRGRPSDRGLLPNSSAGAIFWNQYCEALGTVTAKRSPLGLAQMLYEAAGLQSQAALEGGAPRTPHSRRGQDTLAASDSLESDSE